MNIMKGSVLPSGVFYAQLAAVAFGKLKLVDYSLEWDSFSFSWN